MILGHDSGFRFDPAKYLQQVWFSWNPLVKMGTDLSNYKGFLIALLPESLFVRLTSSLSVGQTMNFVFWFFIMGIGMYICLRSFFPEKKYWPFRLTASVFYMYNFFLLQGWFITERAKFSLFAALPILVAITWKMFDRKITFLKESILFGFTLFFLNGGGSPPLYGGILVTQAVLTLFFLGRALWMKRWTDILYIGWVVVGCVFFTILFNAYWLIPQAYVGLTQYSGQLAGMGGFSGVLSWENVVSRYASFVNLLRLQGVPDWYDNPLHPYSHAYLTNPLLIIASFLPAASVIYVLFRKHLWKPYTQFRAFFTMCIVFLLLGLIMTAGSHPPTGFLYVALLKYIPGFLIFRTAFYKFGPAVWFSLIVLSSFAFFVLITQYVRNRLVYISLCIFLIVGILLYLFPYFSGNFFTWNKPFSTKVTVPRYVEDMFAYINTHHANDRSLIMILPPLDSNFHADGYTWGFWGLDILVKLGAHVPVIANDGNSPLIHALYDAAVRSDSRVFLDLATRIGVNKILWRDDVLYADKTTTSDNFSFLKHSLLESSGISKEKQIDKWTLYDFQKPQSSPDLIDTDSTLYKVGVDSSKLHELFGSVPLGNIPIVQEGDISVQPTLTEKIQIFVQGNIYAASCVFCDPSELRQIENMFPVTYTRFLPDSPLYNLVAWKEAKTLTAFGSAPEKQIDADLSFATKRLAEIWGLIDRDNKDNTDSLALKSFIGFKERVDEACSILLQLNEIDKNAYKARIGAYLKFFTKYLAKIDEKNILPKNYISTLYEYLSVKIHGLSEDLWITDALSLQKFYLITPVEDQYELIVSSEMGEPVSVVIDDQIVKEIKSIHLNKGIHKLALKFVPNNAIASSSVSLQADILLAYGQQKVFEVPKISSDNKYAISFNYRVTKGKSIYMAFHQDNDAKDAIGNIKRALVEPLKDDGVWHSAEYVIQPNFGAQKSEVVFFTADSTDEQSSISISELMVQNIKPANIFAIRHTAVSPQKTPNISYRTINPAVYSAAIDNATDPYIFRFGQSFDVGWKLFIVSHGQAKKYGNILNLFTLLSQKRINSTNHFALDTIANAWYLDKTGSYDLVVVYLPYIIFLASVFCTSISILIGLFVLVKDYYAHRS